MPFASPLLERHAEGFGYLLKVTPVLRAVIGRNKTEFGPPRAPSAKSMRRGVDMESGNTCSRCSAA
jgi:hypothetical protein